MASPALAGSQRAGFQPLANWLHRAMFTFTKTPIFPTTHPDFQPAAARPERPDVFLTGSIDLAAPLGVAAMKVLFQAFGALLVFFITW